MPIAVPLLLTSNQYIIPRFVVGCEEPYANPAITINNKIIMKDVENDIKIKLPLNVNTIINIIFFEPNRSVKIPAGIETNDCPRNNAAGNIPICDIDKWRSSPII